MENYKTNIVDSVELDDLVPNTRQQDKLILYIRSGDHQVFRSPEVQVNFSDRQDFLEDINSGKINDTNFSRALSTIACPIEPRVGSINGAEVFSRIEDDKQIKGIIAQFANGDFSKRDYVGSADLETFFKRFPNPLAFEPYCNKFLESIGKSNGQQKAEQYKQKIDKFEAVVYS